METEFSSRDALTVSLKENQYRSDSPKLFEESIRDSFNFLGYESRLISGKGDTDVLVTANIGRESYKITIDAKTTKEGKITDHQIDWLSLLDHQKKNKSDFILVVGPDFSGGNLEARAMEKSVSLIKTDYLIKLIDLHSAFPFNLYELKDIFSDKGEISSLVEDIITQNETRRNVLKYLSVILEEMVSLQDRLGYFSFDSLAGREKIEDLEIEPEDINHIIQLLELPFINAISPVLDHKFVLTIDNTNLSNLFNKISLLIQGIAIPDHSKSIESPIIQTETDQERKLGTRYFAWEIKDKSIRAFARKDNPYIHWCPIDHFFTIMKHITNAFIENNIVNHDTIFQSLKDHDLTKNRVFKGRPEEYKIRMLIGILELENLIAWTGSKRPIEYNLNASIESIKEWTEKIEE